MPGKIVTCTIEFGLEEVGLVKVKTFPLVSVGKKWVSLVLHEADDSMALDQGVIW